MSWLLELHVPPDAKLYDAGKKPRKACKIQGVELAEAQGSGEPKPKLVDIRLGPEAVVEVKAACHAAGAFTTLDEARSAAVELKRQQLAAGRQRQTAGIIAHAQSGQRRSAGKWYGSLGSKPIMEQGFVEVGNVEGVGHMEDEDLKLVVKAARRAYNLKASGHLKEYVADGRRGDRRWASVHIDHPTLQDGGVRSLKIDDLARLGVQPRDICRSPQPAMVVVVVVE